MEKLHKTTRRDFLGAVTALAAGCVMPFNPVAGGNPNPEVASATPNAEVASATPNAIGFGPEGGAITPLPSVGITNPGLVRRQIASLYPNTNHAIEAITQGKPLPGTVDVAIQFGSEVDLQSAVGKVLIINLTTGQPEEASLRLSLFDSGDPNRDDANSNTILISRPGRLYDPNAQYLIVAKKGIKDTQGNPLSPSDNVLRALDPEFGSGPLREYGNTVLSQLVARGIQPSDVLAFTSLKTSDYKTEARAHFSAFADTVKNHLPNIVIGKIERPNHPGHPGAIRVRGTFSSPQFENLSFGANNLNKYPEAIPFILDLPSPQVASSQGVDIQNTPVVVLAPGVGTGKELAFSYSTVLLPMGIATISIDPAYHGERGSLTDLIKPDTAYKISQILAGYGLDLIGAENAILSDGFNQVLAENGISMRLTNNPTKVGLAGISLGSQAAGIATEYRLGSGPVLLGVSGAGAVDTIARVDNPLGVAFYRLLPSDITSTEAMVSIQSLMYLLSLRADVLADPDSTQKVHHIVSPQDTAVNFATFIRLATEQGFDPSQGWSKGEAGTHIGNRGTITVINMPNADTNNQAVQRIQGAIAHLAFNHSLARDAVYQAFAGLRGGQQ
ncbi:twin-arginine translocation signal domain-containing protein [Candidatus Saccharibacteria bacterium]|nr:twin-arginine translocation signal domain-containing protein [Candidatus Saccharibacteria bacterium]